MSCKNPTHGRRTVPLRLPAAQAAILGNDLDGWIAGIEEDQEGSDARPGADSPIREAEAFRRLRAGLDAGEITLPDEEARAAMAKAADGCDETEGYERAVAVHDAHHALIDVLGGAGAECAR
jgi:hypothetical protein